MTEDKERARNELLAYIRAAARQYVYLKARTEDRKHIQNGESVYYAIDTNIIKLFSNPYKVAVRDSKDSYAEQFGKIFPGDTKNIAINIGNQLAQYIFYELESAGAPKPIPKLLFPQHFDEMRRVFFAIARAVDEEIKKIGKDLDSFYKEDSFYKDLDTNNPEALLNQLGDKWEDILGILIGGESIVDEFNRLNQLIRDNCIISTSKLCTIKEEVEDQNFISAMCHPDLSEYNTVFNELYDDWVKRLLKYKDRRATINIDADTLARIEWINKYFAKNKQNSRIVFITGDYAIRVVANSYVMTDHKSFGEKYIRYPRGLFDDIQMVNKESLDIQLSDENKKEPEIIQWLDILLSKLRYGGIDYLQNIQNLALTAPNGADQVGDLEDTLKKIIEQEGDIIGSFQREWSEYLETANIEEIRISMTAKEKMSQLVKILDKVDIKQYLKRRLETTRTEFIQATVVTGFSFIFHDKRKPAPRSIPVLMFEDWPATQELVTKILNCYVNQDNNSDCDDFSLVESSDDLEGNNYSFFLIYGLLYGVVGQWFITEILAKEAIQKANSVECLNHEDVTGREAYFLLAVAQRHLFKNLNDLETARESLQEAKSKTSEVKVSSLRFKTQNIAIDVTKELYFIFCQEESQDSEQTQSNLIQISARVLKLLRRIKEKRGNEDAQKRIYRVMFANMERNLLINIFQIAIIFKFKFEIDLAQILKSSYDEILSPKKYIVQFSKNEKELKKAGQVLSYRNEVIYRMAQWCMSNDPQAKKENRLALRYNLLLDKKIKENAVLLYDTEKYKYFRNLVTTIK